MYSYEDRVRAVPITHRQIARFNRVPAGKVYLSPLIDCFDGLVASWSIGTRPDAELVNKMLDAATIRRPILTLSLSFAPIEALTIAGPGGARGRATRLTRSMSRKAARSTMQHAKVSSAGSKQSCSILGTGAPQASRSSSRWSTHTSAGITQSG